MNSKIIKARVYAMGPDVEKLTWASDLPEQFITNNIVRFFAEDGSEGFGASVSSTTGMYDFASVETIRPFLRGIIGRSAFEREAVRRTMDTKNVVMAPQALGAVDVALWDLLGKQTNTPIYQLLGGARKSIQSYASTPMYKDAAEYVDRVYELREMGFKAIKFHCFCDYERDLELVEAVQKVHGNSGTVLMLDVEQRYSREEALKMAQRLDEYDYGWFEAPLPDLDLGGYRDLRRRTNVKILPSGNYILDLGVMAKAIEMEAWSSLRCEATFAGGITGAHRVAQLAAVHGMNAEFQTWGYTLTQAAGLHVALGNSNISYFEHTVPYSVYEHGCNNPIRTDKDGFVHAPEGPGLGLDLDWDAIEAASVLIFEEDGKTSRDIVSRR